MSEQKFKTGVRVHVCKEMPDTMKHFHSDFDAIVEGTYGQMFDGRGFDRYALIMLNDCGEPINAIAWYYECQLTLVNDNIEEGLKILEYYRENKNSEDTKRKWREWYPKHPIQFLVLWKLNNM